MLYSHGCLGAKFEARSTVNFGSIGRDKAVRFWDARKSTGCVLAQKLNVVRSNQSILSPPLEVLLYPLVADVS